MEYSPQSKFVMSLYNDICNLIDTGYDRQIDENEFNDIALRLFTFQYSANEPYKKYCEKKGMTPSVVKRWEEIPAVPTDAFKTVDFICFPRDQIKKTFVTSGTSDPEKHGKYYLDERGLTVYQKSEIVNFYTHMFPDGQKNMKFLVFAPSPETLPNSAMAYCLDLWKNKYGTSDSVFLIGRSGFDMKTLVSSLRTAEEKKEPVVLVGASFGFVPLFDYCEKEKIKFNLPEGSRSLDGGGFKGKSREISKEEFYSKFPQILGIPSDCSINLYAMTEMATQFPDNVFRNRVKGVFKPRFKEIPPWARTISVDPDTLERLPMGADLGLLRHYDLANFNTVLAIQTDDIGYGIEDGFEVIGRAKGAEGRGCALNVEELLNANKE